MEGVSRTLPPSPFRATKSSRCGPEGRLLLVVATLQLATGCHDGIGFASWMLQRASSSSVAAAVGTDADATLAAHVEDALLAEPALQGTILAADADHGHVTLHGHLNALSLRDRALQIAESVPGVVDVDDQLDVRPESASEAESFAPAVRWRSRRPGR